MAAACKREADVPAAPAPAPTVPAETATGTAAAVPELKDVIETTDGYIVGISYPATINKYPGLAQAVSAYADSARVELMQAVAGFGNDKPSAPYELSLSFEQVVETPELVAVAADGSRYTGGAHGEPLVARFVWLPGQNKLLTANELVPRVEGWAAIGAYIREQLHTSVSVRADADEMAPQERLEFVRSADKMIDEGTEPDVDNFDAFQPIVDAQGKITALRFVFAPYQVGPYADGTQTVDVPAAVLLPHLAPEYSGLFAKS
ncbi:MAG: PdaC/SigV domain-containing protein [Pseudoxanthomonas sp.]